MPKIPVNSIMCDRCGAWPIYDWCCPQHGQALCRDCLADHKNYEAYMERPIDHIHANGLRHIHLVTYRLGDERGESWASDYMNVVQHDHGDGEMVGWFYDG